MAYTGKILSSGIGNFFGILDMSIVNAFVIYKEKTGCTISQLDFRSKAARGLLSFSQKKNN